METPAGHANVKRIEGLVASVLQTIFGSNLNCRLRRKETDTNLLLLNHVARAERSRAARKPPTGVQNNQETDVRR